MIGFSISEASQPRETTRNPVYGVIPSGHCQPGTSSGDRVAAKAAEKCRLAMCSSVHHWMRKGDVNQPEMLLSTWFVMFRSIGEGHFKKSAVMFQLLTNDSGASFGSGMGSDTQSRQYHFTSRLMRNS